MSDVGGQHTRFYLPTSVIRHLFSVFRHPTRSFRNVRVLGEDPADAFRAEAGADAVDELVEIGFTGCLAGKVDLAWIGGRGGEDGEAHHVETEAGVDLLGEAGEFL